MRIQSTNFSNFNYPKTNVNNRHLFAAGMDTVKFSGVTPAEMSDEEFASRKDVLFDKLDRLFNMLNCSLKDERCAIVKKNINKMNIGLAEKMFNDGSFSLKHAEFIINHSNRKSLLGKLLPINAEIAQALEKLYDEKGPKVSYSMALYSEEPEQLKNLL